MARIIMSSLSVAGDLIATQTGLAYAQTFDPEHGRSRAPSSRTFFSLLGVVLIFATDLHHLAIGAIEGSYTMIPPGARAAHRRHGANWRSVSSAARSRSAFSLPRRSSSSASSVNAAIGLLARLMPQLQVFFIAMPVNILAGLFLLLLLIGSLMTLFLNYYATEMGRLQHEPRNATIPSAPKNRHSEGSTKRANRATSSKARKSRPS